MAQLSSTKMSRDDLFDVADPRYNSIIIVTDAPKGIGSSYNRPEMRERITRYYPRVLDPEDLDSVRKGVFETCELLEHILSFLPAKNIYGVRRVSKFWNNNIATSVHLQEKMFLRLSNKPNEIWTVDAKHKIGANDYDHWHRKLKNTELNFRRVEHAPDWDTKTINPVKLNPMLRQCTSVVPSVVRAQQSGLMSKVTFTSWVDIFQYGESDFWNTSLADPVCHTAEVRFFTLRFEKGPSTGHHAGHESCMAADASAYSGYSLDKRSLESPPVSAHISFSWGPYMRSQVGLTMGDVFREAFKLRGSARCGFSDSTRWTHEDATMYDVFDAVKKKLGVESVPKIAYMQLQVNLLRVGCTPLLIPTEEERVAANVNWKPSF
jgi:hypothetical protein